MPIPQPGQNEDKKTFVSRCIGEMAHVDPSTPPEQRAAICYSTWERHHGKSVAESKDTHTSTEQQLTIVADLAEAVVDTEHRVIRNVALLGPKSVNADGKVRREYTQACRQGAVGILEGAPAFIDHPDPKHPNQKRSLRDMYGTYKNVRLAEGGMVRGDLELFDTDDGKRVLSIAKQNPQAIGNSIHTGGRVRIADGVEIVEEILPRTQHGYRASVDLVEDPATTRSLFESRDRDQNSSNTSSKENDMEWKDVTISGLRTNCADLCEEIRLEGSATKDPEIKTLKEQVATLQATNKTLTTELDTLKVAKALTDKTALIDKLLAESKLPVEAKTKVFRDLLLDLQPKDDKSTIEPQVKTLIEDRVTMLSKKGVQNYGGDRSSNSTNSKALSVDEVIAQL